MENMESMSKEEIKQLLNWFESDGILISLNSEVLLEGEIPEKENLSKILEFLKNNYVKSNY
jgi:light-regulated signal transduction histidine kinase (bacteriophytochrome)